MCPMYVQHVFSGSIVMSTSKMLCLVRYYSLMVGELFSYESSFWKLYLLLRKIVDLCCAKQIQCDSYILLDSLIFEHNRFYLISSKNNLTKNINIVFIHQKIEDKFLYNYHRHWHCMFHFYVSTMYISYFDIILIII